MIGNIFGLLLQPKTQWAKIAEKDNFSLFSSIIYVVILALLPTAAWYYGTTKIGWVVGDGESIKMTADSAAVIVILFYCTMIASVCAIGYMVHWMSETYGANSSVAKGIAIAGFAATPLFISGAVGFLPIFWVALLIGVSAVCYAVYLLYLGIPIVMAIPEERGFLFSSAVVAFCLVILMVIMGGTVILWDMGAAPSFVD
jgi:hypothetical protein